MKHILSTLCLLAAFALPAAAQDIGNVRGLFGLGGTDDGTQACYVAVAPRASETPVVTFWSATSDKAGRVIRAYTVGSPLAISAASSGATNYFANTGIAVSNEHVVVVYDVSADACYKRTVSAATTTYVVLDSAVTTAVGDVLYKATEGAARPVGAATVTDGPGIVFAGQEGKPLLLQVDGTSACQINAVGGFYVRNP